MAVNKRPYPPNHLLKQISTQDGNKKNRCLWRLDIHAPKQNNEPQINEEEIKKLAEVFNL